ncbi:MAG: hypothetical protein WC766_02385 [Patescibacteria group bacterium]|jgi:hypothetical protein
MSDSTFRFTEIEYGNSPTDEKIVGVFRFENAPTGKPGPQQVIVAEVFSTLYAYERLLDLISTTVEQSRALTAGMTMDPFARFEKLVQRLNEAVLSFQEKEPTPLNWNRVNIFLIECSNDQLCISGHGNLMNMFLQKKPDGTYQVFDLCGSLDQPSAPDPKKIFSSVICGDMKSGDLLFIGSANFERLRDNLKIKDKLTTLPPVSAVMEMKQSLEQSRTPDDFAAILISCHPANKPNNPVAIPIPKGAQISMQQLRENEMQTNQTLAPLLNPIKTKQPMAAGSSPLPPKLAAGAADAWQRLKQLIPKRRPNPTPATRTAMQSLDAGHGSIFTAKRKTILIGGVALILLLVIGYSTYAHNKKVTAERSAWEQKFSQATDFFNRAESSLMYAKDAQTATEVQQSEALVSSLDASTDDRKQRVEKLKSDLNQIKEKLRKASVASNIIELYSLPVTAPDGSLTAPAITDANSYVADNSNHQIVKTGLSDHNSKNIALPDGSGNIIGSSIGQKSLVLLDDKGQFYALGLDDDKLQTLNKVAATTIENITDMVIYNNRAYVLDGTKGQIYRLTKTTSGFGSSAAYTQTDVPLAGAVSLAIDSNVFVAKADGTILKLLSGKQEPFSLATIDPVLKSLSSVWTDIDDPRIIATDPANKRLLIFDKNGLLTAQITSPEFTSLRDVSSKLGQKQTLVVSGNRLLLVPLP